MVDQSAYEVAEVNTHVFVHEGGPQILNFVVERLSSSGVSLKEAMGR